MSGLLDEVLAAHGGVERWRAVTAISARGRFGGLLRSRFRGNRMANVKVRVQLAEQHTVFDGFPYEDQRAVFDRGDVRIETHDGELIAGRPNARAAFTGLGGLRRNLRWDRGVDSGVRAGMSGLWGRHDLSRLVAGGVGRWRRRRRDPLPDERALIRCSRSSYRVGRGW